ncbi:MAG: hypothetical protein Tsb0015_14000 [Simkaniaceae bacterium]
MSITILALAFIFLIGAITLTGLKASFNRLGRVFIQQEVEKRPKLYLFYALLRKGVPKDRWEGIFFILSMTKQLCLLCYVTLAVIPIFSEIRTLEAFTLLQTILFLILIILLPIVINFFIRSLAEIKPFSTAKFSAILANVFIVFFFPITFFFCRIRGLLIKKVKKEEGAEATKRLKYKILELIQESEIASQIDPYDRRLISSVASFRDRIVREIMVPRINVLCLPCDQSVAEAANSFIQEGYSRVPVYENDVDHIIGVLLFKDLLQFFIKASLEKNKSSLETPIKEIIKPIIYTPETKRISKLLQEFRNKQIHLAIVVDEYGGTEGIVTIEDILEELVGEIADEYDYDETALFIPETEGGWIVDARMNIVDIEKELKIPIPKSPEYDTIGGYIFHKAGTIPLPGFRLHHDNFDLIVISSNERTVEKVRIVPL